MEFIVDDETGKFYFLEVNTRLQVPGLGSVAGAQLWIMSWRCCLKHGDSCIMPQLKAFTAVSANAAVVLATSGTICQRRSASTACSVSGKELQWLAR